MRVEIVVDDMSAYFLYAQFVYSGQSESGWRQVQSVAVSMETTAMSTPFRIFNSECLNSSAKSLTFADDGSKLPLRSRRRMGGCPMQFHYRVTQYRFLVGRAR